jgi:hypothetical protein
MATSDDDRIAYLTGEGPDSLPPDEQAALDELRGLLREPATWEEPGPALEEGVVAAIASEASRTRPSAPSRSRARGLRLPWARGERGRARPEPSVGGGAIAVRGRARPGLALGALAAAAIAVVAILISQTGSSTRPPLQFAMVVSGTPLAPSARGAATLTKTASGWRVELAASGLPHLEGGLFYQAWLKNAAGVLVPIGTFNDARHVTLWSGVPVTKFRTLTVTRQRANGNPASSGMRVLVGTIRASR